MKEKRILWIAVIFLLILNLSQVGFDLYRHYTKPKPRGPKELIIDRLHFDEGQKRAYEKLISQHREDMELLEGHRKQLKEDLYEKLSHSNPDGQHKIKTLSKLQATMEQLHFQHFLSLKALCRPDQLPAFDSLSRDLAKLVAPKPPKPPKHPDAPKPPRPPKADPSSKPPPPKH